MGIIKRDNMVEGGFAGLKEHFFDKRFKAFWFAAKQRWQRNWPGKLCLPHRCSLYATR